MTKYKLEDLKVGAVFVKGDLASTITAVGKFYVLYLYSNEMTMPTEDCASISAFLDGLFGDLVKPTTKVTYVQYWNCLDLSSKKACIKELWDSRASTNNKFIREFEIEVGEDGFPIDSAL